MQMIFISSESVFRKPFNLNLKMPSFTFKMMYRVLGKFVDII